MGVHAPKPAGIEAPQESQPALAILRGDDVEAQHLALALFVDAYSYQRRDVRDAPPSRHLKTMASSQR